MELKVEAQAARRPSFLGHRAPRTLLPEICRDIDDYVRRVTGEHADGPRDAQQTSIPRDSRERGTRFRREPETQSEPKLDKLPGQG